MCKTANDQNKQNNNLRRKKKTIIKQVKPSTTTSSTISSTTTTTTTTTTSTTTTSKTNPVITILPSSITVINTDTAPFITETSLIEPTPTPTLTPTPKPTLTPVVSELFTSNIVNILEDQNIERRIKNLTEFTWSTQMAQEAIEWSKKLAIDNCNLVHGLDTAHGQNLYGVYGSTTGTVENAVNAWIDEKNLMSNPNATSSEIGHYLIVISPHLSQVGCGLAMNTIANCLVATCNYI